MAAITQSTMLNEFFELWEGKCRSGANLKAALAQIRAERKDLWGVFATGKTPLAKSIAEKGGLR